MKRGCKNFLYSACILLTHCISQVPCCQFSYQNCKMLTSHDFLNFLIAREWNKLGNPFLQLPQCISRILSCFSITHATCLSFWANISACQWKIQVRMLSLVDLISYKVMNSEIPSSLLSTAIDTSRDILGASPDSRLLTQIGSKNKLRPL